MDCPVDALGRRPQRGVPNFRFAQDMKFFNVQFCFPRERNRIAQVTLGFRIHRNLTTKARSLLHSKHRETALARSRCRG
jgi:hypothetical protein